MKTLFNRRELIGFCLLLMAALGALLFFHRFSPSAFPEYAIHFRIGREEAARKAQTFARQYGFPAQSYKQATVFHTDAETKAYLERSLGVPKTASLAEDKVHLWHFSTRFFRPMQLEEVTVDFLPNGRLIGYNRLESESQAGSVLTRPDARRLAEQFIAQNTPYHLSDWQLVEMVTQRWPHRTDHTFTWESRHFDVGGARNRITVGLLGRSLGKYEEKLDIPDAWDRQYEKERAMGHLARTVTDVVTLLGFLLPLIILLIRYYRQGQLRFRFAYKVGTLIFLVSFIAELNSTPLYFYSYKTTVAWSAFIFDSLGWALISSIYEGLLALLVIAVGEAAYREAFPNGWSLETAFTTGWRSKTTPKLLFMGGCLGVLMMAYVAAYYLLGRRIGFWSPGWTNYSDSFSTLAPWAYVVQMGFLPAVFEEGIFRLFGVSLLRRYLKNTPLAVLITAVIWAFLHSTYPQSPWYVRGVEITAVGLLYGFLLVRYGVLVSIAAHYTYNALTTSFFLFHSNNPYIEVSATLASLIPLMLALGLLYRAWRWKGFSPFSPSIPNEIEAVSIAPSEELEALTAPSRLSGYRPFGNLKRALLFGLIVGIFIYHRNGSILLAKYDLSNDRLSTPYQINANEALDLARSALSEKSIRTSGYHTVVEPYSKYDDQAVIYISQADISPLSRDFASRWARFDGWSIRFFRPLQSEEYWVFLLPNGRIERLELYPTEDAPGARLSRTQALFRAQEAIGERDSSGFFNLPVQEAWSHRKNRDDYSFTFDTDTVQVGAASLHSSIDLLGNQPSYFKRTVHLPETWLRQRDAYPFTRSLLRLALNTFKLGFWFFVALVYLRFFQEGRIHTRRGFKLAGLALLPSLIGMTYHLPTLQSAYTTESSLTTFTTQWAAQLFNETVALFLLFALLFGLVLGLWEKEKGSFSLINRERKGSIIPMPCWWLMPGRYWGRVT